MFDISDLSVTLNNGSAVRVPVCAVLGYGCMLGWSTLMVWSSGFLPPAYSDFEAHAVRLAFILAAAVALLLIAKTPRIADGGRGLLAKAPLVFLCALPAGLVTPLGLPYGAALALWTLAGVAHGAMLHLWYHCLAVQNQKRSILILGGSFALSGLIVCLFYALQPAFRQVVAVLLVPFSLLMFYGVAERSKVRADECQEKVAERLDRGRFFHRQLFLSIICNAFVGFLASCATSDPLSEYAPPTIGVAFLLAGLVMTVLLVKVRRNLAFHSLGILLPFSLVCLLVFSFAPLEGKAVALAGMVFIFSCFDIQDASNLSRNAKYLFSDYAKGLSGGRAYNRFAFAVGWAAGYMVMWRWFDDELSLAAVCLVLFGLLSLGITSRLHRLGRDSLGKAHEIDAPAGAADQSEASAQSCVAVDAADEAEAADEAASASASLDASVEHLATLFKLSKREREVFAFLAKGRNVRYISSKLVVSVNTVRTHAYNIYGKLDVHSQQELINLVEETSLHLGR